MAKRNASWRRSIRAQARDARVLLGESRGALILFVTILIFGGLALRAFYINPETGDRLNLTEAVYASLGMIFFQNQLPLPENPGLRVLFFIIPIVGLVAVADGVLRFGAALVDKQSRGQKWQAAMATTYNHHVIVCGLGKVGFRVAQELLKMGRDVVGIEQNPDGRFVEQAEALGIPVLIADARRPETLTRAGVTRAEVIIPATENELTNLDIALDARELNPDIKIVMRMFDPDLARRIEKGFGIDTAYSVSALAAPVFAAAAMRSDIKASFYAGETLLNVVEITVAPGSAVAGQTVAAVEAAYDVSIVAISHAATADVRPGPGVVLSTGDRLMVMGSLEQLSRVTAAMGD